MTEAQLFHCPTCGAPLDIQSEASTIRCPYCQNSVIVPETLRSKADSQINDLGDIHLLVANNKKTEAVRLLRQMTHPAWAGRGLGLKEANDIVDAMERGESIAPIVFSQGMMVQSSAAMLDQSEILELVQGGQKIEAIKKVRLATNLDLKEAKDVVEALESGDNMALVNAVMNNAISGNAAQALSARRPAMTGTTTLDAKTARRVAGAVGTASAGMGCGAILFVVFILAVTLIPILFALTVDGGPLSPLWNKINPIAFAAPELSFGSEGIGPGQFNDPRTVAVDKVGNLYAGDFSSGRLQSFDPSGAFRWVVNLGEDQYINALDIGNGDVLFAVIGGQVRRFESATGRELDVLALPEDQYYAEDLAIAPDGRMAVVTQGEDLLVFNNDLQVVVNVPDTFLAVTGDSEATTDVDIDPQGNIFLLGGSNEVVLKYSPVGKFINQFGGETIEEAPGKFRAVGDLAVDMQGRVYVSDIFNIQVFDGSGMYLDKFDVPGYSHGMNFDFSNRLYIASNLPQIMRMKLKK